MSASFGGFRKICFLSVILFITLSTSLVSAEEGGWWSIGTTIFGVFSDPGVKSGLTADDMAAAFKDVLHMGTENVVSRLGRNDGFNADSNIHIPLPGELDTVKTMMSKVGMSYLLDDLELKLNRAAEAATPKAKALFWQAITEMTFDDVKGIYEGPENAATKYFQKKMTPSLSKEMLPIVEESLSEVGAIQSYDNIMGQYQALPFVPNVKADLTNYVIEEGVAGIFYYIAKEEAAIRQDPARQTTDLLKQVFGQR